MFSFRSRNVLCISILGIPVKFKHHPVFQHQEVFLVFWFVCFRSPLIFIYTTNNVSRQKRGRNTLSEFHTGHRNRTTRKEAQTCHTRHFRAGRVRRSFFTPPPFSIFLKFNLIWQDPIVRPMANRFSQLRKNESRRPK